MMIFGSHYLLVLLISSFQLYSQFTASIEIKLRMSHSRRVAHHVCFIRCARSANGTVTSTTCSTILDSKASVR
jgi:hypothetical protein